MIQEQKTVFTIGNRAITQSQALLGLIVTLTVAFIIYGSFNQPPAEATEIVGAPSGSFLVLAMVSFAGGLFSFLSPCTLPILPAYFAFAFRSGRATIAANTLAFMLGLATMFSLFGAGASSLGSLLYRQQNLLLIVGGTAIMIFGIMSLLGQGFAGSSAATQTERSSTMGGSFLFGLTFAVGWSSCVGPILGIVLTLAATTASVTQGIMLLFIYAMGLGLPLMIVSALFGRASRDSLVWRLMRGKGYGVETSTRVIAIIWGVGLWLIAIPLIREFMPTFDVDAIPLFSFSLWHIVTISMSGVRFLLLILFIAGAVIVDILRGGGNHPTMLHLHSTSLISGVLFLLMGMLLLNSQLSLISGFLESSSISIRLLDFEQAFLSWVSN
ncbi:MAG: cytochrome c biogenesis CcdA family protein [Candidatus Promineifilaceae bacterium]